MVLPSRFREPGHGQGPFGDQAARTDPLDSAPSGPYAGCLGAPMLGAWVFGTHKRAHAWPCMAWAGREATRFMFRFRFSLACTVPRLLRSTGLHLSLSWLSTRSHALRQQHYCHLLQAQIKGMHAGTMQMQMHACSTVDALSMPRAWERS